MSIYAEAIAKWNLPIPEEAEKLLGIESNTCLVGSNQAIPLPWPPLTPAEIASAADVSADWGLPHMVIPVMGDFHNLVCLEFSPEHQVNVVILNDQRQELARFLSIAELVSAITPCVCVAASNGVADIIQEKSWLNF